jgi:mannosyltransferase OCH1-like enzyme
MQTLYGYEKIPRKWQPSIESIKTHMPAYMHTLLHGSEYDAFVSRYFPDFLDTFREYQHDIQKADAIRYMWLYVYGGIYIDLDTKVTRDLSPLFERCTLALAEDMTETTTSFSNFLMASVPRHPFWLDCLDLMKRRARRWYWPKSRRVVQTTGPGIVSEIAKKYREHLCPIPASLVNSCSLCDRCAKHPNTFAHQMAGTGGSWLTTTDRTFLWIYCNRKICFLLCVASIIFFKVWIISKLDEK